VKQHPDDFRVEEVSRLEPGVEGEFALYRLEKTGIGTPEALRIVRRAWRLAPRDVAFAGLKDRHGRTGQTISIRRGPRRNHEGKGFKLNYLGRSDRPAARGTIVENRFRIVLRHLAANAAAHVIEAAGACARDGFANYFDDQRFGSVRGTKGRFVADALLRGDAEGALRLAVAAPARKDRSGIKRRRRLLQTRWGRWEELAARFEPSLERRVCAVLAAGGSFDDAYRELDPALRSLHLSALQARIFNACLRRLVPPGGPEHPGLAGPYRFWAGDPGPLRDRELPLATAEAPPDPVLDAVLADDGLDRAVLEILPFRRGRRSVVVAPGELRVEGPAPDERNPGRCTVTLAFSLPPGAYATMLVKRCSPERPSAK